MLGGQASDPAAGEPVARLNPTTPLHSYVHHYALHRLQRTSALLERHRIPSPRILSCAVSARSSGNRYERGIHVASHALLVAAALAAGSRWRATPRLCWSISGALPVAGHGGCSAAIENEVTHPGARATAMMILANNILGFASGPSIVAGSPTSSALLGGTATCIVVAVLFMLVGRECERGRPSRRIRGEGEALPVQASEASLL
jgi:hypothetical protein